MDGLNTGLGTGEDSGKSALDRYAGGAVSGPVSLNGGVAFGAPAAFLGLGNAIRFSSNQVGDDAYIYQGSGNGLNVAVGLAADGTGTSFATAVQGGAFNVSSAGGFTWSVFAGATVGAAPTTTTLATLYSAGMTVDVPLSSTGVIAAAGELQSTSGNAVRMVNGNYGAMLRNDGVDVYLLSTPSGGQYGTWNNFRPFIYNLASGAINFDGTGAGVTFGGAGSFAGALSAAGAASFTSTLGVSGAANLQSTLAVAGLSTLSGGVTVNGSSSFNAGAYWGSSGNRALVYQGAAGNLQISTNRDGAAQYYFLFGADGSFSTNGGALNAGATSVGALTSGTHTVNGSTSATGNVTAAGAMSAVGSITSQASGNGYVALEPGSTGNPGYIAFFTADNTRRGYIGWQSGTSQLSIESENGWNYNFSQRPLFAGNTPWDSANFNPANYQPAGSYQAALGYTPVNKAGDIMSGGLTLNYSQNQGTSGYDAGQMLSLVNTNLGGSEQRTITLGTSPTGNGFIRSPHANLDVVANGNLAATFGSSITMASRPSFNGNLAWDAGNFNPANYQPAGSYQAALGYTAVNKAGDTMSGALTVPSITANTGLITLDRTTPADEWEWYASGGQAFFWNSSYGNTCNVNYSSSLWNFAVRPTFAGAVPWDANNFNPANYQPAGSYQAALGYTPVNKAGDTMTGLLGFSGTGLQVGSGATQGLYGDGTNVALRGLNQSGATIFFQSYNGGTTYATFASGAANFSVPLEQSGNQVWHAGNSGSAGSSIIGYTPANKAGDTFSGNLALNSGGQVLNQGSLGFYNSGNSDFYYLQNYNNVLNVWHNGGSNVMTFSTAGVTAFGNTIARVQSGTAANSGLISWGTGTPGTLAVGQIYFQVAAT